MTTPESLDLEAALRWANRGNPDYAVDTSGYRKVLAREIKRLRTALQKIVDGPDTRRDDMLHLSEEAFFSRIIEHHEDTAREALCAEKQEARK